MRKEASLSYYNSISVYDGLRKTTIKRTAGLQAILRSSTASHSTRITVALIVSMVKVFVISYCS